MDSPDGGGIGLEIVAGLQASIGSLTEEVKAWRSERTRLAQAIHPFTVPGQPIAIASEAGTLDQPNLLGPRTGKFWDIRRLAVTGFSAGTVTGYLNSVSGDIAVVFSEAGVLLNGKGQLMIGANDRLVFSAASITGTVTVAMAGVEIDADRIGEYLI